MGESGLVSALPAQWRWWEDGAHDGAGNMAADQALLATVGPATGTWRWYKWARPTVSFGRNERATGRYSPQAIHAAGYDVVRRPTGGRALLHWRELTYSVALPLPASAPWRLAYNAINDILLSVLRELGVEAQLAPAGAATAPDGPICFARPSEGEIMVRGGKLVGSAVWRQGDAYLQHGSILLHDDQGRLESLGANLADMPRLPAEPAAGTLAECLPNISDDALHRLTYDATHAVLSKTASVTSFLPDERWHEVVALQQRQCTDPAWIWRR